MPRKGDRHRPKGADAYSESCDRGTHRRRPARNAPTAPGPGRRRRPSRPARGPGGAPQAPAEALATAEQRYRSLVEHLPLVTYVDSRTSCSSNLYTSPQIEPLLGSSRRAVDERPGAVRETPPAPGRQGARARRARALPRSGEPLRTEYRLVAAATGRVVWLQDEAVAGPRRGRTPAPPPGLPDGHHAAQGVRAGPRRARAPPPDDHRDGARVREARRAETARCSR